jgi:hypothetical protein
MRSWQIRDDLCTKKRFERREANLDLSSCLCRAGVRPKSAALCSQARKPVLALGVGGLLAGPSRHYRKCDPQNQPGLRGVVPVEQAVKTAAGFPASYERRRSTK